MPKEDSCPGAHNDHVAMDTVRAKKVTIHNTNKLNIRTSFFGDANEHAATVDIDLHVSSQEFLTVGSLPPSCLNGWQL